MPRPVQRNGIFTTFEYTFEFDSSLGREVKYDPRQLQMKLREAVVEHLKEHNPRSDVVINSSETGIKKKSRRKPSA